MNRPLDNLAFMAAQALPALIGGSAAPEWVHLLPTRSGPVETMDARGPYAVTDAEAIIAASFAATDRIEIDINHATFLAAPRGERADAMGWITAMEARDDGIWGRVEWNAEGGALVAGKAYRNLSPVVRHDPNKTILSIANVSLVNRPNLRGLTALNQEGAMTLLERLAELLGLDATASETEVFNAVSGMKGDKGGDTAALQSQMSEIGLALGLGEGGDIPSILAAAKKAKSGQGNLAEAITSLQAENAGLAEQLNSLTEAGAKATATAFIEGEIKRGRAGVKPLKDHYIAMHMADPARVEKEINALPILTGTGTTVLSPAPKDGEIALNAEQISVAKMLGQDPKDYAATLAEARANEETL